MFESSLYISIFVMGLSYGATACMFSCMPFLTPILATTQNSTKEAMRVILPFSLGRIVSYIFLATVSYASSLWIKKILDDTFISSVLLGVIVALMGVCIFVDSFKSAKSCSIKKEKKRFFAKTPLFL